MLSSYLPEIGSVHSKHSLTLVRSQKLIETLLVMIQSCFFFAISHKFGLPSWKIVILSEVISVSESMRGWFIVAVVVLVSFQLQSSLKNDFSRSDGYK